jgi:uncharacterized membrane protein HdeD (DUF308 family)
MSTNAGEVRRYGSIRHELDALRGEWAWFLALGIALIVLGTIAVGMSVLTTFVTVLAYGVLLIIAGIAQSIGAFWSREWSGFFLSLLSGILYLVVGVMFVLHPGAAALALTLLLAAFLLVSGVFRIVAAFSLRLPHWGWPLVSGILNVLLGLLIWAQWPLSGLWVIGLFVGIELIFGGWTWVMIALALRSFHGARRAGSPA